MKAILPIAVCILLTGCGGKDTSSRLDAVEAQNRALAARILDLSKATTENAALLTRANSRSEILDKLLKELAARTDANIAGPKQMLELVKANGAHADELFEGLKKYTDQMLFAEEQARGRDEVSAIQNRTDESHAVCDFFNPDLLTLRTWSGLVFYVLPVEVIPHNGGATLRFRVGNPYAAQFTNTSVTVACGVVKPKHSVDGVMDRQMHNMKDAATAESADREVKEAERRDAAEDSKWLNSLKTFSVNRDLLAAGSWTEIEVLVPEATLAELRYVEVSVSPGGIALTKEQR